MIDRRNCMDEYDVIMDTKDASFPVIKIKNARCKLFYIMFVPILLIGIVVCSILTLGQRLVNVCYQK